MKSKLTVLFLIPACLLVLIGCISQSPGETTLITETAEETILVTTMPAAETNPCTTESEIQETTLAPIDTSATNPQITTEEYDGGLRRLGTFRLTAYCSCQKCCGEYALNRPVDENGNEIVYGSIGVQLKAGISIAVDPRVIPYETQVVINGHTYTAHDTGGAIKGNSIDVYFDNHEDAWNFGVQYAEVFIYDEAD